MIDLISYNIFDNFFVYLTVEIFILFFIITSFIFFFYMYTINKFCYPLLLMGFVYISIFVTVLCTLILVNSNNLEFVVLNGQVVVNSFVIIFKFLILLSLLLFFVVSFSYFQSESSIVFEYFIVLWLSVFSLFILVSSNDFMIFFLAMELQGLSAYVLTTAKIKNNYSTEAGLKYFTLNSYATGIGLFGISLLYGISGTTNFSDLQEFFSLYVLNTSFFYIVCFSILLILIALFFKLTAAPFHFWAVDVYDGSPTVTMFFFLLVPKIAILNILFKLVNNVFFSFSEVLLYFLMFVIFCSVIVGSFGALYEFKVKRLLVYSGISNVAFLLINFFVYAFYGIQTLVFYIIIYVTIQCSFFIIYFVTKRYTKDNTFMKLKYIEDFIGMFFANPLLAFLLTVSIFSMSGIPPLAGFFTKLFVFYNLVKSNFIIFTFILIFINFASYVYYVRFVRTIVLENIVSTYVWNFFMPIKQSVALLIFCFFIFNIFFFFYGLPLITIVNFMVTNAILI